MALTIDEILELQAKILAARSDSAVNPNMTYSSVAGRNKALNPEYFTGNDTKVVNAINKTYKMADSARVTSEKAIKRMNSVVMDTETYSSEWNKLQNLMTKDTIVEGLIDLYENKLSGSIDSSLEYATEDDIDSIIKNLI